MIDITTLRATNFQDVVGNKKIIDMLKNALKFGFPEFTIFEGQEGIGKTTLSKIVAKHLICPNSFNGLACEECDTCKEVDQRLIRGNKDIPNVITFRMSDEGGKRAARKIEEYIRQVPQGSDTKVIILEECQGISIEAQDLLLPILEYIPKDTKIIACTTNIKALQRTFTSRANILNFKIPQKHDTVKLLTSICEREGIKIVGNSVIPRIVEYANNKPRASVKTLQTLTCQGYELNISIINDFLNIVDEEHYLNYIRLLRGDMGLILDFIDKLVDEEVSLTDFVKGLNDFMVKLITLRYRTIYLPESIIKKSKELLESMDEQDLLKIQSIISDESPKIVNEEYSKSQLISMSFKIMNRNNEGLLQSQIKSKVQVEREKEIAFKNHLKKMKEQENQNQLSNMDLSNNPNALLKGLNAQVIKKK